MNALQTAAQQALEALEYENSWHEFFKVRPYASTVDAITALRAALAQQAGLRKSRPFTKGRCVRMAQIEKDAHAEFEIGPALAQQTELVEEQVMTPITQRNTLLKAFRELMWIRQFIHKNDAKPGVVVRDASGEEIAVWIDRVDAIIETLKEEKSALLQQAEPTEKQVMTLIAQRNALLEVLKYLDKAFRQHGRQHWPEAVRVGAAIKAVEEQK